MMELSKTKMRLIFILCLTFVCFSSWAQRYSSSVSEITFFSDAPIEDIKATNKKAKSVFDAEKGQVAFSVPIDQFEFRKSLMQEHFNEKYLESEKYPKATFAATLKDYVPNSSDSSIVAEGTMEIHGVKKKISIPGSILFSGDEIVIACVFEISLEDYDIKIPSLMFKNIAEVIEVTVRFEYQPL